jgi:hypothetical protein
VGRKKRFLFARLARRLDPDAEPTGGERIGSVEIQTRGARAILAQVERPYERSRLFEWLLAHHDEVISASGGRRMEWRRLCGQFESAGLVGRDGKAVNATTARKTWQRVRKEKARIDALRAAERAERERRAAANPRRDLPSQFRKGEYGPPLATTDQGAGKAKLPATTARQAELGLQLSTAVGVVITKVTRVFKLREDGPDYVFNEDGSIYPSTNLASALAVRQQMNISSGLPVNDKTERSYAELELRSEYR